MSSLSLHGVDDRLVRTIKDVARRERTSVNRAAKRLLERMLGLSESPRDHRADFAEFFGVWSKHDLAEFERTARDTRRVDREDWR